MRHLHARHVQRVAAEHAKLVRQQVRHIRLAHAKLDVLHAKLVFPQQRRVGLKRREAAILRDLPDGLSGGLRRLGGVGDQQAVEPAGLGGVAGAALQQQGSEPRKLTRIGERLQKRLRLELRKGHRQRGDEHGGAGGVGIDVVRGRDPGFVQHLRGLADLAEVLLAHGLVVRDVDARAAAAGDVDGLLHALLELIALVAQVGGIYAAVSPDWLRQRGQLIGRGEAPRRIGEPCGQAQCARLHGVFDQLPHLRELPVVRRVMGEAHHSQPDGPVRDEIGEVDAGGRLLHAGQIGREAGERPVVRIHGDALLGQIFVVDRVVLLRDRRGAEAALAAELRGDALQELTGPCRVERHEKV